MTNTQRDPKFLPGDHVTVWRQHGHKLDNLTVEFVGGIPAYGSSAERLYRLSDGNTYPQAHLMSATAMHFEGASPYGKA